MVLIQFTEEEWELKGHRGGLDTKQDDGNMFEIPTLFHPEEFFT
jgi:hypothetical protein